MYFQKNLILCNLHGSLMVISALDSRWSNPGLTLGGGIALRSWAKHFTLTVPLFTEVYKWVPANLLLGVTLRWTSIPSRGEQKYSYIQSLHAKETGISSAGLMGHFAQTQTLHVKPSNEKYIYLSEIFTGTCRA